MTEVYDRSGFAKAWLKESEENFYSSISFGHLIRREKVLSHRCRKPGILTQAYFHLVLSTPESMEIPSKRLRLLDLDGAPDDKITEAFTKVLEGDKKFKFEAIAWANEMRGGAYLFACSINGRGAIGYIIDPLEVRGRAELLSCFVDKVFHSRQLNTFNVSFTIEVILEGEKPVNAWVFKKQTLEQKQVELNRMVFVFHNRGEPFQSYLTGLNENISKTWQSIYYQLLKALALMHGENFLHGDLSPGTLRIVKVPAEPETPYSHSQFERRLGFLLQINNFIQLTRGAHRMYEKTPWGITKGLGTRKDTTPGSINYYTCTDEGMIAANLFNFCRLRLPRLWKAVSALEKDAVARDEHISSHVLNMMESFRQNMTVKKGPCTPLNVGSALTHCLFFTAQENMQMISTFISQLFASPEAVKKNLKKALMKRIKSICSTIDGFGKSNWLKVLSPTLQMFVEGQNKLNTSGGKSQHSESEMLAENNLGQYSYYDTLCPTQLFKLIRNIQTHWDGVHETLRIDICGSPKYSAERYLLYFTIRFHGLITTLYEFCSKNDLAMLPLRPHLIELLSYGPDASHVMSEYVSPEEVQLERNRIAGNNVDQVWEE